MSDLPTFIGQLESAVDGIEPGSLKPDTVLHTVPVWDSLALLSVLAMADAEFGVTVTGTEVKACHTVADLHALIAGKKNG